MTQLLTLEAARANSVKTDWDTLQIPVPWFLGRRMVNPSIDELVPFIDWTPLFAAFGVNGRFPAVLDDPAFGTSARQLYERVQLILERISRDQLLVARGVYGFWPANTIGDDIAVYKDDARASEIVRLHMLRQQERNVDGEPNQSLADFVAPKESFAPDYIGAFAVTAGSGVEGLQREYDEPHDGRGASIGAAVSDRLAEAFAEYLHAQARNDWGYGEDEALSHEELIDERYRGIRPVFGYPACPDLSEKPALFRLLHAPEVGITLSESFDSIPAASIAGIYLSHPRAQYFDVGRIGRDQIDDYAARKGVTLSQAELLIRPNLAY